MIQVNIQTWNHIMLSKWIISTKIMLKMLYFTNDISKAFFCKMVSYVFIKLGIVYIKVITSKKSTDVFYGNKG